MIGTAIIQPGQGKTTTVPLSANMPVFQADNRGDKFENIFGVSSPYCLSVKVCRRKQSACIAFSTNDCYGMSFLKALSIVREDRCYKIF